jgi:hypothetical protein
VGFIIPGSTTTYANGDDFMTGIALGVFERERFSATVLHPGRVGNLTARILLMEKVQVFSGRKVFVGFGGG